MARLVKEKSDVLPLVADVFRELGYEGATMSRITERTGVGKGSLYHFFPGGKDEMVAEVLAEIEAWFSARIFEPLERSEPRAAIAAMWGEVDAYFRSGRRICLIGAFALDETRDRFASVVNGYFKRWIEAMRRALARAGIDTPHALSLAEVTVSGIQGALVIARALDDPKLFSRSVYRLRATVEASLIASAGRQSG